MKNNLLLIPLIIALVSLFGSISYYANAKPKPPAYANKYEYKVLRVLDGDTVEISAPFLPVELKPVLKLRIFGIDTPEKGGLAKCDSERAASEKAKQFVIDAISRAKRIRVVLVKWDKFGGRVLGDLVIDGALLSKKMIDNGHAREYYGAKKLSWCEGK